MDLTNFGMSAVCGIGNTLKANAAKLATSSYQDMTSRSLSQFTRDLQLRPTFAIEAEILSSDHMGKLIRTGMSNYAGFYILALSIDNTIMGVSVGSALGKYSPTRDATGEAINAMGQSIARVSTASYKPSLKTQKNQTGLQLSTQSISGFNYRFAELPEYYRNARSTTLSTEASIFSRPMVGETIGDMINSQSGYDEDGNPIETHNVSSTNLTEQINEMQNLAVGQIIQVDIKREKASATVNLLLKPELNSMRAKMMIEYASLSKKPMTLFERYNAFFNRETIYSAWDYLTCRDLAEAHARNLVQDTTGYYEKIHKRSVNNKIATLLTGNFSVGTVANTWIISSSTALRIEASIGSKLNKEKPRNKFMEETGVMTLIVFDEQFNRVFIYNHGIPDISEVSIPMLEKKQKDKDFDFDVFKMLAQGGPII